MKKIIIKTDGLVCPGINNPTTKLHIATDSPTTFINVEWVFQFNDDEPSSVGEVKELTIRDTNNSNIVFTDGKGNQFKIFAREKITS